MFFGMIVSNLSLIGLIWLFVFNQVQTGTFLLGCLLFLLLSMVFSGGHRELSKYHAILRATEATTIKNYKDDE